MKPTFANGSPFQCRDICALEVGAFAGQQLERGLRQALSKQVALALVKGGQFQIGTYFQCADISALKVPEKALSEADFCQWLTAEIGVAAIPLSAFYGNGFDQKVIRFCFAKKDETLLAAIDRLKRL